MIDLRVLGGMKCDSDVSNYLFGWWVEASLSLSWLVKCNAVSDI
jgi:hypothetical protein